MTGKFDISVTANSMVRGFPYHDGKVLSIAIAGEDAILKIRSEAGMTINIVLEGLKAYWQSGSMVESIVGYIYLLDMSSKSEMEVRQLTARLDDEFIYDGTPTKLFRLESIMGVDISAICRNVSAFEE